MNDSERIASRIKGIIDNNSQDIAFIIGNGIHRYAESLNKAEYISWNDLLIKLSEGLYEEVRSGISNTEFFDIIELHNLKRLKEKQRKDAEEFLRNGFHLDENAQFLLNKKPLNKLLLSSLNKQIGRAHV